MADLKCPTGMVLIRPAAPHRDEPAFCINKTEVAQEDDDRFWAHPRKGFERKGFELIIKFVGYDNTKRVFNSQRAPLEKEAALWKQFKDVVGVEIKPTVNVARPQRERKLVGPRKPAVLRSWEEARAYCQGMYGGGDLPTVRQWRNACGEKAYCTASGTLNHKEAIYDVDGPADVGSTPANPRGVQDMTGNVWEWLRDDVGGGFRRMRGGSWQYDYPDGWRADFVSYHFFPFVRFMFVGFRCVAPPLSPATQPAKAKVAAPRNVVKKK